MLSSPNGRRVIRTFPPEEAIPFPTVSTVVEPSSRSDVIYTKKVGPDCYIAYIMETGSGEWIAICSPPSPQDEVYFSTKCTLRTPLRDGQAIRITRVDEEPLQGVPVPSYYSVSSVSPSPKRRRVLVKIPGRAPFVAILLSEEHGRVSVWDPGAKKRRGFYSRYVRRLMEDGERARLLKA
jgi:hypothetical protein